MGWKLVVPNSLQDNIGEKKEEVEFPIYMVDFVDQVAENTLSCKDVVS